MSVIIDGTDGITTPELDSSGPVAGTTANFSGNVTLGSSVLATPTGSAPSYTCRAWVNFNGTDTVAINASGNVASITDNGTGDYTVNFTTAMPDGNYSVTTSGTLRGNSSSANGVLQIQNIAPGPPTTPALMSTTQVRVAIKRSDSASASDSPTLCVAIFR